MVVHRKIAYALACYDSVNSGVYKKILDQLTAWKSAGHSGQIFVIRWINQLSLLSTRIFLLNG